MLFRSPPSLSSVFQLPLLSLYEDILKIYICKQSFIQLHTTPYDSVRLYHRRQPISDPQRLKVPLQRSAAVPSARYLQAPAAKPTLVSPIQRGAVTGAVVRADTDSFRTGHSNQAIQPSSPSTTQPAHHRPPTPESCPPSRTSPLTKRPPRSFLDRSFLTSSPRIHSC